MDVRTRSNRTFWLLVAILAGSAAITSLLPQMGGLDAAVAAQRASIPAWQMVLAAAGVTLVLYGGLGYLGLLLWRRMKLPEIWEASVTNRQRFLIPALVGLALGIVLIVADLLFAPVNGIGRLIHPPFPTSLFASISAGIGEEILFRLFFISFWTWLVGKVILRGRGFNVVYWVVAVFSGIVFAVAHLPSLMFVLGVEDPMQFSPVLLAQILLLNGLVSLFAAHYFRKYGFLAPVGIHFWADVVWHIVWGLF
jgi:hypothetical protein